MGSLNSEAILSEDFYEDPEFESLNEISLIVHKKHGYEGGCTYCGKKFSGTAINILPTSFYLEYLGNFCSPRCAIDEIFSWQVAEDVDPSTRSV